MKKYVQCFYSSKKKIIPINNNNLIDIIIDDGDTNNNINKYIQNKDLSINTEKSNKIIIDDNDIKTFIKYVYHEIRIPINNLKLSIDILKTSNELKSTIDLLNENIDFLDKIINTMIDINKFDYTNIKLEPFNIIGLIHKIKPYVNNNTDVEYIINNNIIQWVIGDSFVLQFVLINLLNNMTRDNIPFNKIKFEINKLSEKSDTQFILIKITNYNIQLLDELNNNDKKIIHDVCNKIIELHDGLLNYSFDIIHGSKYIIYIPFKTCMETSLKIKLELTNNILQTLNVMIVDDSEICRKLLSVLIIKYNSDINIVHAVDGLDAINKLDNNINNFDIIFMDHLMPNMNGSFATKIIRALGYSNLIIGITGNNTQEEIDYFMSKGVDYIFAKPFGNKNLNLVFTFCKLNGSKRKTNKKIIIKDGNMFWI